MFLILKISIIWCFLLIIPFNYAYKPVVLLHGVLSDGDSMLIIEEQIKLVRFIIFIVRALYHLINSFPYHTETSWNTSLHHR